MAQDPPEVTWAVDAVVVGAVVAGVSVVVLSEPVDEAVVVVGVVLVVAAAAAALAVDVVVVAVAAVRCDVWAAARPAKRATPPTEAAATDAVIRRVRRRIEPREAGAEEVMGPVSATRLGGS
jgi:hypothetical protein